MDEFQNLSHTVRDCKCHVVWIPKYRKKVLYGELRKHLGGIIGEPAMQKESNILEGHLMLDHIHMLVSIPPKYSVAQVVGFIKGKSAIQIARAFGDRKRNFTGQHFWARGYFEKEKKRKEKRKKSKNEKGSSLVLIHYGICVSVLGRGVKCPVRYEKEKKRKKGSSLVLIHYGI